MCTHLDWAKKGLRMFKKQKKVRYFGLKTALDPPSTTFCFQQWSMRGLEVAHKRVRMQETFSCCCFYEITVIERCTGYEHEGSMNQTNERSLLHDLD